MRLIDADALMVRLVRKTAGTANKRYTDGFNDALMKFRSMISTAPTIEAEPVVHTKWEIEMDDMGWNKHTCPNCGYVKRTDIHVSLGWNYCPNCGAKMDGGADHD